VPARCVTRWAVLQGIRRRHGIGSIRCGSFGATRRWSRAPVGDPARDRSRIRPIHVRSRTDRQERRESRGLTDAAPGKQQPACDHRGGHRDPRRALQGSANALVDVLAAASMRPSKRAPHPSGTCVRKTPRARSILARAASSLPGVPTISETLPGVEMSSWLGLAVPAATPRAIIDRLNGELRSIPRDTGGAAAARRPERRAGPFEPRGMRALVEREIARWRRVIELKNIERRTETARPRLLSRRKFRTIEDSMIAISRTLPAMTLSAALFNAGPLWAAAALENDYVLVSRDDAPCARARHRDARSARSWRWRNRAAVRQVLRAMRRGEVAVFKAGESYRPPTGGAFSKW